MHTLTIKLKQHTPLIHFQHDQDDATLRASEVKPKLDRFILTRLGNGDYQSGFEQAKARGWLIGKGVHPALNYKMNIINEGHMQEYLLASSLNQNDIHLLEESGITAVSGTPFFAQEKENGQICCSDNRSESWNNIGKKGLLLNGVITISIISKSKDNTIDLFSYIAKNAQRFFISVNFGTRQNKGFGSFSTTRIFLNGKSINLADNEVLLKESFSFVYKKVLNPVSVQHLFKTINDDYKLLKSGRTQPSYAKSKLLLYANHINSQIGWDKKYIKNKVTYDAFTNVNNEAYELKCKPENQKENYSDKLSHYYYRALLGLAEQYEFLLDNPPAGNSRNKMIIRIQNTDIQRYQSPLLFKVIENTVFLVGNDDSATILGKPFNFLVSIQGDEYWKNEPLDTKPIFTPSVFSLRDFISFAMKDRTNNAYLGYTVIKA